jgi:hypothetical protein
MIAEKKYFSIAEVSEITGLSTHKLRYVEKSDRNLSIIKMRGRRYYTKDTINYLKQSYIINSIIEKDREAQLDQVSLGGEPSSDATLVGMELEQDGNSLYDVSHMNGYKINLPRQLDLGIKFSVDGRAPVQQVDEDLSLSRLNKNANQIQESPMQIFTQIESKQVPMVSRIDRLLNKLYKMQNK